RWTVLFGVRDAVVRQLAIEGLAVEAEEARRGGLVALDIAQGAENVLALAVREAAAGGAAPVRCRAIAQPLGQVVDVNPGGRAQHQRPLDDVLEDRKSLVEGKSVDAG